MEEKLTVLEKNDAIFVGMLVVGELIAQEDEDNILEELGIDRIGKFMNLLRETSESGGFNDVEASKTDCKNLLDNVLKQLGI